MMKNFDILYIYFMLGKRGVTEWGEGERGGREMEIYLGKWEREGREGFI